MKQMMVEKNEKGINLEMYPKIELVNQSKYLGVVVDRTGQQVQKLIAKL